MSSTFSLSRWMLPPVLTERFEERAPVNGKNKSGIAQNLAGMMFQ